MVLLAFEPSIGPFAALVAFGFLVGIFGHIIKSSAVVLLGILLIFAATVILPLVLFGNPY